MAILAIPSHFLGLKKWFENSLEWFEKNDVRMVWLCEFRGGTNGWDLKILYKDLKSWKKKNEMVCGGLRKLKKMKKWNAMEWVKCVCQISRRY